MVSRGLRDLDMVRRLMDSAKGSLEAKAIKEKAVAAGFEFAMSLYGVLTEKDNGRSSYRRIEVVSRKILTGVDVELIYRWFQKAHPIKTYSIWLYDHDNEALTQVFSTW